MAGSAVAVGRSVSVVVVGWPGIVVPEWFGPTLASQHAPAYIHHSCPTSCLLLSSPRLRIGDHNYPIEQ